MRRNSGTGATSNDEVREARGGYADLDARLSTLFGKAGGTLEGPLTIEEETALTNAAAVLLEIVHRTSGMAAAGLGGDVVIKLESDGGEAREAFRLRVEWATATDAARSAIFRLYANNAGTDVEVMRGGAPSGVARVGFLGATAQARPAPYTQSYAGTSRTLAAYTPDAESVAYSGQNNADASASYARVVDLNALRVAYETLRASHESLLAVTNRLIDDLQGYGLLA